MYLTQEAHIVNALPPIDCDGSTGFESDWFSLSKYQHASVILTTGANGGAGIPITVQQATSSAGASAAAIAFAYGSEESASGDTLSTLTNATATGFTTHASAANLTYVLEVDGSDLDDGYDWVRVVGADPGASAVCMASVAAVLTGARYQGDVTGTAIT